MCVCVSSEALQLVPDHSLVTLFPVLWFHDVSAGDCFISLALRAGDHRRVLICQLCSDSV